MNYKDWLMLQTLFHKKNITKTAGQLYISQPSLTYRLKQLESELGITILTRNRRGVEFTEQGEYLVKYASDMLLRYRDLKENLVNLTDETRGTLNLGVARAIAIYTLPGILRDFKGIYPKVDFTVQTGLNLNLIHSVYKQDFHVGIVRGNHHWSEGKHILSEENICILSSSPIDISALPNLPRIDYQTDPALIMNIDKWWKENFSSPPNVTMKVDNMEIAKRMALHGLGYTIVPSIVLDDKEPAYTHALRYKNDELLKWTTWVLYRNEYLDLSTVKEFVNFLKDYYHC